MKNVKLKVRDGEFIRTDSNFRNWITKDGSPGESGLGGLREWLTNPTRLRKCPSYWVCLL